MPTQQTSVAPDENPDDSFNLIDLVAPTPAEESWNPQQPNNSVCTSKSFAEDLADLQLPATDPPNLTCMNIF